MDTWRSAIASKSASSPLTWFFGLVAAVSATLEAVIIGFYAAHKSGIGAFAVGVLASGAAGVVGMFAGFLFGIPRYTTPSGKDDRGTSGGIQSEAQGSFTPSSNLEQVADWLTKILLGAGLVQLSAILRGFNHIVNDVANALAGSHGSPAAEVRSLAGSILILNLVAGFPMGYIVTTLWYSRKLNDK